ncbi:hypothetical protein P376_4544 [Streptomyces sp. HCCB10043]|nr:hypothetical protein P376_4544 [Streptomyces sp. HCCB10043]
MGVEPAAARAYDRAAAAGLADAGQTELPGPDAGVGGDLVEGVAEDVEPGGGGALVGALERVDLFQRPVGLDDDEVGGGEAQGLGEAGAAAQAGEHRGEHPDGHGAARFRPAVEHGQEPCGVRGGRSVRARRRLVPGGVRQQEVDERGFERGEGVVHGHRVVVDVDRAEQAEVQVAVALLAEQSDRSQHHRMAAAPVGVPAVAVVGGAVAVEGDPDPDVELVEEVEVTGAELDAVGVDPEVQLSDAVQGRAELLADPAQSRGPCQERFPAVQDHCDGGKRMSGRMLGQTPGCPGNCLVGDDFRSGQPALICMFVDVAVVAGEIAPAVHFENEFTEGDQGSCHSAILASSDACSESGIERGDPGGPGRGRTAYAVDLRDGVGAADVGRREGCAGLRRGEVGGGSVGLHGRPRGILRGSVSGH